jgi:hypothetical protein
MFSAIQALLKLLLFTFCLLHRLNLNLPYFAGFVIRTLRAPPIAPLKV